MDTQTIEVGGLGFTVEWPVLASVNGAALALSAAAIAAVFLPRLGMIPVLLAASAAGIALHLGGLA